MYFIEYNKQTGEITGCINFEDKTKNLIPITEQKYIAFIEGADNLANYNIQNGKIKEKEQKVHLDVSPHYKTTQLIEIQSTNDPDIEIKVSGGCVRLFAHSNITISGLTYLYITLKNNPIRFERQIQVDLEKLQRTRSLTFEIPSIIEQQISIYTANNEIKFGLNNE